MGEVLKVADPGLLIPAKWLRDMGQEVTVERAGDVLLIESARRAAARRRLQRAVKALRRAAQESDLTEDVIAAEVATVRAHRARRR